MSGETRPPRNTRGHTLDDPVPAAYVAFEDRQTPIRRRPTVPNRIGDWIADQWTWLVAPWRVTEAEDELDISILRRIEHLENRMTSAENTAYARAAEVVGLIRAEFASLRQQVQNAATAGAAALEADAQVDADRIAGLVDELASVLPATVPDVPVPAPGEPAELPAEPVTETPTDPAV